MPPAANFTVDVPGEGNFVFRQRSMRTSFQVEAEFSRLTEGVATPTEELENSARVVATLKTMAVEVPDKWDIDAMDPDDEETAKRLLAVYNAYQAKLKFFRAGGGQKRDEAGEGKK